MINKILTFGLIIFIVSFGYWIMNQKTSSVAASDLPSIVNGQQIVKMAASYSGYSPNRLKIKAGIPVVWQITTSGNAGCASALVAPSLFSDMVILAPSSTTTKEFTVSTPGVYRFSCSMGMYTGSFEVIN